LRVSRRKGVWVFVPPGETSIGDPYVDLRAWATDGAAVFALAGEAAAWHLGYLDRRHDGRISLWVPEGVVPPFGIRSVVSVVRLGWDETMAKTVQPSRALLRERRLDLTDWASRLPAFGPEALLVQLATRPSSFRPWMDLVSHLEQFANDCDANVVVSLLYGKTSSAWQRAAYLLSVGSNPQAALVVFEARPNRRLGHVTLGDAADGEYVAEYGITDRLVAPLLAQIGKA
jgi:AbiEi antitoxin C-terminal domain